ncbi:hypothetical protein SAMN05421505_1707 [Sinosporangium album]|uniref:Uncharacterized protein n=1 Tax=Sinosporangium album TaxID=504805 RepID=A0A1G8LKS5_9ACTN|nr:hypothetical protein [Sinosporangium album]SDI56268.1 hypothetical protein SAMN05421505_1707 [Sinosporangium album]
MRDTKPPEIPSKTPGAEPTWASRQVPLPKRVPGAHWPRTSARAQVPPADSRLSVAAAQRLLHALRNLRFETAEEGRGA